MATATAPPAAALAPHRFTVADYYRMAEAGILAEDDRVELLAGQVVDMSPIGPAHASAVDALGEAFAPLALPDLQVAVADLLPAGASERERARGPRPER
jgi:hypothetical protein